MNVHANSITAKSVFLNAVESCPQGEWGAFLDRECHGNPELRRQVEWLLAGHRNDVDLIGKGSDAIRCVVPTLLQADCEDLGTQIGPYKLREVLGEGGMGIVYAAEQERPIRRKVALKVIKPGMDSREVIARFEAERQALALMDHQNIAKVLDAGSTETGRPYFVMELVRGMPLSTYCDQAKVPLCERLKLFITVCQAVQHAHQKGIVHRDLKPSNVMVTLHDGKPVPKIIDFGVAKALNQRLTDQTVYTRVAQLLGTPMYMSPEQAELSGLDVDTRSDVYSLGVLLYELLTGQTPFDKVAFSKLGYDQVLRIIREDEPPRPSARISTLAGENRSTVATQRGLDDRHFSRALRGELDWIVMKGLEKDRTRRYGSADALAADLQRYLDDEPVQACPPSAGYRLRKFTRRRRSTISAVSLALMVGIGLAAVIVVVRDRTGNEVARVTVPEAGSVTVTSDEESVGNAPTTPPPIARAPSRVLPGLIPTPPAIPGVARWQLITRKPRGVIRSAVWSPDEQFIALAEANHVRIYDARDRTLLHVLIAHSQPVRSVAWHPDGKRLASCSEDGTVRLWTSTGIPTHLLSGHAGPVYQVAWRADGVQLASCGADGTIRLWSLDGKSTQTLDEGGRHVFGIDWSPDGTLLATVGGDIRPPGPDANPGDNTLRIWHPDSGKLINKFSASVKYSGLCVDWRPDGEQLAVGYGLVYRQTHDKSRPLPDAGVRIWNTDGTPGPEIGRDAGSINALAWDSTGERLAFSGRRIAVGIWNASDQQAVAVDVNGKSEFFSLDWSRDATRLLIGHRHAVYEWKDHTSLELLVAGIGRNLGFWSCKWSPDGTTVSGEESGTLGLFWTADGAPLTTPEPTLPNMPAWWTLQNPTQRPDGSPAPDFDGLPTGTPIKSAWSRDGWLAAATWFDQTVRIWDDHGKLVKTCLGHRGGVESVAWSPDGMHLVSGGGDSVRIWNRDGTPGPVMTGHEDEVYGVAWSPDGQWIASGGTDSMVRLWKPNGEAGPVLRGHLGGVYGVAFSPDSRKLASGSWLDNTLRVWDLATGKTEWQAIRLNTETTLSLSDQGEALDGNLAVRNADLLAVIENRDGTTEVLSVDEFDKQYAATMLELCATRNDVDEAARVLQTLLRAQNPDAIAEPALRPGTFGMEMADFFSRHGRYEEAITVCTSVLPLRPAGHIYKRRGAAYMGLKEYDKALADITTAVEMNPDDASNFRWFGESLLWESPPEVQQAFFDLATKAIALSPANYSVRAGYYEHRGEHEKARADLEALLAARPDDAWSLNNVAWAFAKHPRSESDASRAVEFAQRAAQLMPAESRIRHTLGVAQYRAGQFEAAIESLQKAKQHGKTDHASWDYFFLAMGHWQLGHYDEARDWFEKAVTWMDAHKPDNPELVAFRREAEELLGIKTTAPHDRANTTVPTDTQE